MSRGRPTRPLSLTAREHSVLRSYLGSRRLSHGQHQRIRIVFAAAEGKSISAISRELGLTRSTVRQWRDRFDSALPALRSFAAGVDGHGVSDKELFDQILLVLTDRQRPGKPREITDAQVQQIVAIACRQPSDFGHPRSDWSYGLIAQVAVEQGIVEHLSGNYARELLKKTAPASA